MPLGIVAWVITGLLMIICSTQFAVMATKYEKVSGVVDYAEATCGKGYAYFLSWFMITIYYPGMTSVLAWVSARYTLVLFTGADNLAASGLCLALACFYLCAVFALNALAPKISGKFQVTTTVIKLIPLSLVAIVGTIVGIVGVIKGQADNSFASIFASDAQSGGGLFAAIIATVFAYEGWIVATSINAELKNAKRNLPLALLLGGIIIVGIYVLYFIGLAGAAPVGDLMDKGATVGFEGLFGKGGAVFLNLFVVISCLGTLNGLAVGCSRGMYAMGVRKQGPRPSTMAEISPTTNMPSNSAWIGILVCGAWLFYFYGANLTNTIFGLFTFDSSEIPIVTIYAFYIPVFIMFAVKYGKEDKLRNLVMPILATLASAFMIFAAFYAHGIQPYQKAAAAGKFSFPILFYLIVFAVIMGIGAIFYKKKNNVEIADSAESSEEA
jgi:APA family basic amino acid/polyamine antiporter